MELTQIGDATGHGSSTLWHTSPTGMAIRSREDLGEVCSNSVKKGEIEEK